MTYHNDLLGGKASVWMSVDSGVAGGCGGEWCRGTGRRCSRVGKMNIINKQFDFLCSTDLKTLGQIEENQYIYIYDISCS